MQASPAKYNLALPTPARRRCGSVLRVARRALGWFPGVWQTLSNHCAQGACPPGFAIAPWSRGLQLPGLLMLGVDDYFRNTSMVNADGLADDAVGDVELAQPAAVEH